jgi:hypothetical protein
LAAKVIRACELSIVNIDVNEMRALLARRARP